MPTPKKRNVEDVEPTDSGGAADEVPQLGLGAPVGKKRLRPVRPTKDRSKIVRASYESTEELEWCLSGLARHLRMKKYDLIFKLLTQGSDAYSVTAFLKTAFVQIHGSSTNPGQSMSA